MSPDGRPIGILHLSDLHVQPHDEPLELFGPLREDLAQLPETQLAFLVVSGDLVDRGNPQAFPVATQFLKLVQAETQIPGSTSSSAPAITTFRRTSPSPSALPPTLPRTKNSPASRRRGT